VPPVYALALLGIVVFQGVLGMLTVTWLLKPLIVTLHLLFGLTTVGLMWWLFLSLPAQSVSALTQLPGAQTGRAVAIVALCLLGVQIALGGWTSSNYAAVACPDFPKCQGAWWPAHTDFRNGFVIWRGLAINFEGGVLENPARVAIHLTHRLGAVIASLALVGAAVFTLLRARQPTARVAAIAVLAALALQLSIG